MKRIGRFAAACIARAESFCRVTSRLQFAVSGFAACTTRSSCDREYLLKETRARVSEREKEKARYTSVIRRAFQKSWNNGRDKVLKSECGAAAAELKISRNLEARCRARRTTATASSPIVGENGDFARDDACESAQIIFLRRIRVAFGSRR